MYLISDDIEATVEKLKSKGVIFTMPIIDRDWGLVTRLEVPGGGEMGLYQPKHLRPVSRE